MSDDSKSSIFRKKNMDRLSSPEQLGNYIKVSNPGVWLVLTAIIVLLAGVFFWMFTGRMDSTVSCAGICNSGVLTCYISESDGSAVKEDMKLTVENIDSTISSISDEPKKLPDGTDSYLMHIGGFDNSSWVYTATAAISTDLDDGIYPVLIVTDTISPLKFILN